MVEVQRCFHLAPAHPSALPLEDVPSDSTRTPRHSRTTNMQIPHLRPLIPCRGPFASYVGLSEFFDERCKMALHGDHVSEDNSSRNEKFDDSAPLVLTHWDINPRNNIAGADGRLWMADRGWAGYCPTWVRVCGSADAGRQRSIGQRLLGDFRSIHLWTVLQTGETVVLGGVELLIRVEWRLQPGNLSRFDTFRSCLMLLSSGLTCRSQ